MTDDELKAELDGIRDGVRFADVLVPGTFERFQTMLSKFDSEELRCFVMGYRDARLAHEKVVGPSDRR